MSDIITIKHTIARGIMALLSRTCLDKNDCIARFASGMADGISPDGDKSDALAALINIVFTCVTISVASGWGEHNAGITAKIYASIVQQLKDAKIPLSPTSIEDPDIPITIITDIAYDLSQFLTSDREDLDLFMYGFESCHLAMKYVDARDTPRVIFDAILRAIVTYSVDRWDDKLVRGIDIINTSNLARRFPDGTFHYNEDGKMTNPPNWQKPDLSALFD